MGFNSSSSIMHHVGIVFFLLWLLSHYTDRCHPVAYFLSFIYLYLVHERYVMRLRRKLQFEEKKQANQKRVLCDSETVRWLNHAVEKIWPICMEQIASNKILLPIIPWFLQKYKPWTAKKAVVQHMYLGRNPPVFTEVRVLQQSTGDDHLVLELGMNFCTADDMSTILAVKLRKRLGFGMWTKLHMTGMHVEGKVLVGVKFIRCWPFISRLRVCFAEPPYFQMTVKPLFTHGLDVTELPGIAGWLDKLLSVAFEQTLVQPNMLVVDVEKFVSPQEENWFSVDEKEPVAYAKVEVIEASDMKPSDLNGLADPYVKGQLGPYRFRTKIQRKTLSPKWHEEFKIPICTWESPNVLVIEVSDKDHFIDDALGGCTVNLNDLRDGDRHDIWLPLQNIKTGRLHLAITILEDIVQVDNSFRGTMNKEEIRDSFATDAANSASFSSVSSEKSPKVPDDFEPINIEGQSGTGIWVHHPGSEVSQTWEPRKGRSRLVDSKIQRTPDDCSDNTPTAANDSSSTEENAEGKGRARKMRRGLHKIGALFHRNPKSEDTLCGTGETVRSPYANIRSINQKEGIGVKLIVEDGLPGVATDKEDLQEVSLSDEKSVPESPRKVKDMAKNIFRHAGKSARSIKQVLSWKDSRKSQGSSSPVAELEIYPESDSSEDESLPSPQSIPAVSLPTQCCSAGDDSDQAKDNAVPANSVKPSTNPELETGKVDVESLEGSDGSKISCSPKHCDVLKESSEPQFSEENLEENVKVHHLESSQ
ncbi:hypothetical protein Tsubulata_000945 [Turnera subulata]|uniref:C2 domain-containing protein n=1 Tax=Turnera subulata TaxID=218843 RepID=A0A9Q0G2U4_9ROSI|nr:hypothetical protein Tsubulata_000945 [Turnera subulata]